MKTIASEEEQRGTEAEMVTRCIQYGRFRDGLDSVDIVVAAPASIAEKASDNCSVGVCYPLPRPFSIGMKVTKDGEEAGVYSTVVSLPNGGLAVAVPLRRHAFVETGHGLTFQNGVLQRQHFQKPSQLAD